jgi:signal peptidase I
MRRTRKVSFSKKLLSNVQHGMKKISTLSKKALANENVAKMSAMISKFIHTMKKLSDHKVSKIISKTVSITLITVLVIVVAAALYMKLSGTSKIAGHQFMIVTSGSMEPAILTGSVIGVKDVANKSGLQVGDVITYKSTENRNELITHRIIEVEKLNDVRVQYITQGDNNDSKDKEPIPDINVVGKFADIHIPILGYIFAFINSKLGAVLFMIIPGVLIIGWQLFNIWKLISNLEEKAEASNASK